MRALVAAIRPWFTAHGWALALGIGIAFSLLTAPMSRLLLPQFTGLIFSSRDVMAVMFSAIGTVALGALAWRISPTITWLVLAYLLSAMRVGYQGLSMANLQTLLWGVALLVLIYEVWPTHKETILWAIGIATVVHLVVASSQYFVEDYGWPAPAGLVWRDPFFMVAKVVHEVEALTSHYSLLAAYLTMATPLLWIRFGWWTLPVVPVVILALKHRGSMFALSLGALFLVPKGYRWRVGLLGGGLSILVVLIRGSFKSNWGWSLSSWTGERIAVWTVTLAKSLQQPWLGWSPGAFFLWQPTFVDARTKVGLTFLQAHNEYLQLLFEVGFVGLSAVLVWVIWTAIRLSRAEPWTRGLRGTVAAVVAVAINAAFSFPFRIGVTGTIGIIALAAMHAELRQVEAAREAADARVGRGGR